MFRGLTFLGHTVPWTYMSLSTNRQSIGSAVFAQRTGVSNTHPDTQTAQRQTSVKVKVKFSHTRYRALGPELIPVYRQSARR